MSPLFLTVREKTRVRILNLLVVEYLHPLAREAAQAMLITTSE
jgi:hypothetical protein